MNMLISSQQKKAIVRYCLIEAKDNTTTLLSVLEGKLKATTTLINNG